MEKRSAISAWMQDKFAPAVNKFAGLHFIRVVTGGIWFIMPMIFTGVVFQVIGNIATLALQSNQALLAKFNVLSNLTYGLMGLFMCIGISLAASKARKIETSVPMIFSIILFFMFIRPTFQATDNILVTNFIVDWSKFGGASMMIAILVGYFTSEVVYLFEHKGWTIKVKGLPSFMDNWIKYMIPGVLLLGLTWVLVYLLNVDVNGLITAGFASFLKVSDSLPAMMLMAALAAFCFTIGIHPVVLFVIFMPFMLTATSQNVSMLQSGLQPTLANGFHFNQMGTYLLFITIGGSGATLGLNLNMLFSKVPSVKTLGKMAIFPSLLNINEPLIFGCPVVFNPTLAIGSILMQGVINPLFAYLVLRSGLVPVPASMMIVPFFPTPLLALILGIGLSGLLATLVSWALDTACWFPFFKAYERQVVDREALEAAAVPAAAPARAVK